LKKKDLAPRARFELATLRLTAEPPIYQNLPELVLIEGIQQVAMKRDKSFSPSLSTFRSPPLVLRFYDGWLASFPEPRLANFRVADLASDRLEYAIDRVRDCS
jgi:hypothetical protein